MKIRSKTVFFLIYPYVMLPTAKTLREDQKGYFVPPFLSHVVEIRAGVFLLLHLQFTAYHHLRYPDCRHRIRDWDSLGVLSARSYREPEIRGNHID